MFRTRDICWLCWNPRPTGGATCLALAAVLGFFPAMADAPLGKWIAVPSLIIGRAWPDVVARLFGPGIYMLYMCRPLGQKQPVEMRCLFDEFPQLVAPLIQLRARLKDVGH